MRPLQIVALVQALVIVALLVLLLDTPNSESQSRWDASRRDAASSDAAVEASEVRDDEWRQEVQRENEEITTSAFREPRAGERFDPEDPVGILLYGTVQGADGAPLERVRFGLEDEQLHRRRALLGEQGTYAIPGLAPGDWHLRLEAKGHRPLERMITLEAAQPRRRLDLVLQPAVVLPVHAAFSDDRPLLPALQERGRRIGMGLSVIATREPREDDFPMTSLRTHLDLGLGRFEPLWQQRRAGPRSREESFIGTLQLDEGLPVFVSLVLRQTIVATRRVVPGDEEVRFTLEPGRLEEVLSGIRGRLVSAGTGDPLTEARVALNDRQSGGGFVTVDESGAFEFLDRPAGLYVLDVRVGDGVSTDRYVRLHPGRVHDLGLIRLGRPVEARFQVLDAEGQPTAASLSTRRLDDWSAPQPLRTGSGRRRSDDGSFSVRLIPGRYRVEARHEEARAVEVIDVHESVGETTLRLAPTGTVVIHADLPPAAYPLLEIRDARDIISYSAHLSGRGNRKLRMAPGNYTLRLIEGERVVTSRRFSVGESDATLEPP